LAASFAQLTIKRVIQTVLGELDVCPAGASSSAASTRSSGATRSSVAFLPGDQALAIVTRRAGHDDPPRPGTAPRLAAETPSSATAPPRSPEVPQRAARARGPQADPEHPESRSPAPGSGLQVLARAPADARPPA